MMPYISNSFTIWLTAIRPKTLPLASGAIFLGSAMAYRDGFFNSTIFLLALSTALLLQIISNLANDYGDALSGADNEDRVGPLRVMESGLVNQKQMKRALAICIAAAIVFGSVLLFISFASQLMLLMLFIGLGVVSIIAALAYTMPVSKKSSPYGYKGFGDIAVFIFFGLVAVVGSYALHVLPNNGDFYWLLLCPAVSCGLLSAAVLNVNNVRDLETDLAAKKFTLAVKLGESRARIYHWALLICAELTTIYYIVSAQLSVVAWLHLVAFGFLLLSATKLANRKDSKLMNQQLKQTALMSFIYCSLLALGHLS